MLKGVFEFEIDGKTRGFKFGTFAFAVACKEDGTILSDFQKKIGVPYKVKRGDEEIELRDPVDVMALLNLFYGAAVQYAKEKKLSTQFDTAEVSAWIDELGFEKVNSMISEGLSQYVPKNSPSLA